MQIATATPMKLQRGRYGIVTEMSSGSSKLQIKDHNDSDSTFVDIPDTATTSSSAYNIDIANDCTVQAVLTGDAELYLLQAP